MEADYERQLERQVQRTKSEVDRASDIETRLRTCQSELRKRSQQVRESAVKEMSSAHAPPSEDTQANAVRSEGELKICEQRLEWSEADQEEERQLRVALEKNVTMGSKREFQLQNLVNTLVEQVASAATRLDAVASRSSDCKDSEQRIAAFAQEVSGAERARLHIEKLLSRMQKEHDGRELILNNSLEDARAVATAAREEAVQLRTELAATNTVNCSEVVKMGKQLEERIRTGFEAATDMEDQEDHWTPFAHFQLVATFLIALGLGRASHGMLTWSRNALELEAEDMGLSLDFHKMSRRRSQFGGEFHDCNSSNEARALGDPGPIVARPRPKTPPIFQGGADASAGKPRTPPRSPSRVAGNLH